jgi:hypothetical protein
VNAQRDLVAPALHVLARELESSASLVEPLRIKRMGEVGYLADLMLQRDHEPALARALLDRAWSLLARGELVERVVREAGQVELAAVYVPFARRGVCHEGLEHALRARVASGLGGVSLLAVAAVVELGLAPPAMLELTPRPWLAALARPWTITEAAAYETVHVIQSLLVIALLPEALRRYATDWLPVWTRHFAHAGQLDVAAELMLACGALGIEVAPRDWQELAAGQQLDGTIAPRRGLTGTFASNAHTTIVAVMAALANGSMGSS